MHSFISPFLVLFSLVLLSSAAAFNITMILNKYPDFSAFNGFLTQTHLANAINSRQTITILVVDNGGISSLSGKPDDVIKRVLSVHVVLDYYDMDKLKGLSMKKNKSTILTTLFQSLGLARNQQGFINITIPDTNGKIMLGSAAPGSDLNSSLVKQVLARPYNICVLQVTSVIVPPGIEDEFWPLHPPKKAPSAHSPKRAPSPAPKSAAPAPLDESESPVSSPPELDGPVADGSDADDPTADGPTASKPSLATRVTRGTCLGVAMAVLCMLVF